MELTLREFENLNLYSHQNMEKLIRKLVNESSNAAFTSMFDDSVVLLDHETGKFYASDYTFDEETLTLKLENFEEVQLVKEENEFENTVSNFFDEENTVEDLAKSYRENVIEQDKYINMLISEVVSAKDFSSPDYSSLKEAKEDLKFDSKDKNFYKLYENRLSTHPVTSIKYFDWEKPVVVSIMEHEVPGIINTSAVEKAQSLWKKDEFKKQVSSLSEAITEEEDYSITTLFENFPVLFYLSESDRVAVLGKTILNTKYRANRKAIIDTIETAINEDEDLASLKSEYITEEDGEEGSEEDKEGADKEKAKLELSPEDAKSLVDDLKKMLDKVSDEKITDKINSLIDDLEKTEEEGTKPTAVKEAVELISL